MLRSVFALNPGRPGWLLPLLSGFIIGLPALVCYATGHADGIKLSVLGGLAILYLPPDGRVSSRVGVLLACSLGFVLCFIAGAFFTSHPALAAVSLALLSFLIHRAVHICRLHRPPGNVFFILIAAIAITMPQPISLWLNILYLLSGTLSACLFGLLFCVFSKRNTANTSVATVAPPSNSENIAAAVVFGLFMGITLLMARVMEAGHPYWVTISCLVVMQGVSVRHVFQRGIQRLLGTLVGAFLTWAVLMSGLSDMIVIFIIAGLLALVVLTMPRNYGLAVIFITMLTMLLSTLGAHTIYTPAELCGLRLQDNIVGCILGAVGGWVLHNVATRKQVLIPHPNMSS